MVLGPAGTGKTLLQQALSVFFWKLGYHILAFAPANANCDHFTKAIAKIDLPGFRFYRNYPSSRDLGPDKMTAEQGRHRRVGHVDGQATGIHKLQFMLHRVHNRDNEKAEARDHGLEQGVINESDLGELTCFLRAPGSRGRRSSSSFSEYYDARCQPEEDDSQQTESSAREGQNKVDVWEVFGGYLAQIRDGSFPSKNVEEMQKFEWSYEACKSHLVRLSRFMITTTGNARCWELEANFGMNENGDRDDCKGIVVSVDEACKDVEPNVWSGIANKIWRDHVKGAVLFGDEE